MGGGFLVVVDELLDTRRAVRAIDRAEVDLDDAEDDSIDIADLDDCFLFARVTWTYDGSALSVMLFEHRSGHVLTTTRPFPLDAIDDAAAVIVEHALATLPPAGDDE